MADLKLNSSGGGSVTLTTPSTASNLTLTLPSASGTLATTSGSLSSPTITGTVAGGATYTSPTLTGASITAANSNTVEATSGPTSTQLAGMRNKIINGAMMIDQRNAGASVVNTAAYTVDRWNYQATNNGLTWGRNLNSATLPAGFINYLGFQTNAAYSVTSGNYFFVNQTIEGYNIADFGWGTANAQSASLSFKVYSSLTGTFGGSIICGTGSYPFTYTISSANTWTNISLVIPATTAYAPTSTTNGAGIALIFGLGVGSTYSGTAGSWAGATYFSATGATSVVGTNGATFYITGVQLEKGATATPFENRLYGTELALCQRYYQVYGGGASGSFGYCSGYQSASGYFGQSYPYTVAMRASPTATKNGTWATSNCGQPSVTVDITGFSLSVQTTLTGSVVFYPNSTDDTVTFSAEL